MPENNKDAPALRIAALGPLIIEVDGARPTNLTAEKARALVIYLAVTERRHTRTALAGLLWPDVNESSARTSLRTVLSQLRKALGDVVDADRQAVWLDPAASVWVDSREFERACKRLQAADFDAQLDDLRAAVNLYRGDFLAGFHVPDAALFEEWQTGQREYYRRAARRGLWRLAKAAERTGDLTQALDDMRRVLAIDPLRESAHRKVMQLLTRQGDRSAALAQFERCRNLLAEELGVDPDPATVTLADAIRSGSLAEPEAQAQSLADLSIDAILTPPPSPRSAPPFMTPPRPPQGIIGREDLLARTVELLAPNGDAPEHGAPVALQGMGGIGKTTSAIAIGRDEGIAQAFPDGVLWASVGPTPTIRNLLDDWGRALGLDLIAERDEAACAERLRSALHARRVLLIVDDIWDINHATNFLVAGPRCRTLLTTRESPIAHALATREKTLRIDVLTPDAALALLNRLAPEAVTADAESARRLCQRLEYLPLAITLAGRMLANEADVPSRMQRLVGELLERREARLQLLQAEGRLGLSSDEPVSLQSVLGMSIARLHPVDQERFAMLAVFGAEPLVWEIEAAAHVWDCSLEEAEATVSRFIQRGLVMRREDQYWTHALLADYAAEMLEEM